MRTNLKVLIVFSLLFVLIGFDYSHAGSQYSDVTRNYHSSGYVVNDPYAPIDNNDSYYEENRSNVQSLRIAKERMQQAFNRLEAIYRNDGRSELINNQLAWEKSYDSGTNFVKNISRRSQLRHNTLVMQYQQSSINNRAEELEMLYRMRINTQR